MIGDLELVVKVPCYAVMLCRTGDVDDQAVLDEIRSLSFELQLSTTSSLQPQDWLHGRSHVHDQLAAVNPIMDLNVLEAIPDPGSISYEHLIRQLSNTIDQGALVRLCRSIATIGFFATTRVPPMCSSTS